MAGSSCVTCPERNQPRMSMPDSSIDPPGGDGAVTSVKPPVRRSVDRPKRPRTRRQRLKSWHRRRRFMIRQNRRLDLLYRMGVAVVGALMILGGAVMVPLPTPGFGWILIFLGLGVWSTEFAWANRVTVFLRHWLDILGDWYKRQSLMRKVLMIGALVVLIVVAFWLFGMLGTIASWFGAEPSWLDGPIRGN